MRNGILFFSDEICPDKNTGKFKYFINELI